MNEKAVRFPFSETEKRIGGLPYLPFVLEYRNQSLSVTGILDTGSTVNVLPYEIGNQLGATWAQQTTRVKLTGNLANYKARAIILNARVNEFNSVKLAFAWTEANDIPLILGQMNFFLEFDVCFYGSIGEFEITPKRSRYRI
jgi:hypothetical protein